MANRRVERLNEQLRREISDILRRDVRDPRIGIPTVTRVEVTPDLWVARVFVRAGGNAEERAAALEGLDGAAAFIRRELRGLKVRRVPELRFEVDKTFEHASRIEELLREVGPHHDPRELESEADSTGDDEDGDEDGEKDEDGDEDGGEDGRE
jgi:ribosome-binding factor A